LFITQILVKNILYQTSYEYLTNGLVVDITSQKQGETDGQTDRRQTDGCDLHKRCPFSPREEGLILPPVEHFRVADQNSIRDRRSYFFSKNGSESNRI
jgi:hypothetical protein